MWEICHQLELLGNSRSIAGADELTRQLDRELGRVKIEIEEQSVAIPYRTVLLCCDDPPLPLGLNQLGKPQS